LEMGGELVGYGDTLVLLPYGPRFRSFRKYFSHFLGPIPMENHVPTVEHESYRFLKRVLANPNDLMSHLRKYVSSLRPELATKLVLLLPP
jgi:hypothetical protein